MQLPLQITFRDIPHSDALETAIRAKAAKLDQFYSRIMSCRVVVEAPHRHKNKGELYAIRVDITVPGGEIVVTRTPDEHHSYTDAYVAIRDAFDVARRQLEDYARRQRADIKTHEPPPHGRVTALYPHMDYGLITTPDNREIYFHRNSVLGGEFDGLEVGAEVRFAEEPGERGPQASTVHIVGKRHVAE